MKFSHLHNHTQYSLLDGASSVSKLYDKAIADQMPAMAITDHGNMFGVYSFVTEALKRKDAHGRPLVKPIVGCEFYMVEDRRIQAFSRENRDKRYHQLLLAKNPEGYKNLTRLCTRGYTEGLYGKYPRIDKELLKEYHQGLIATSCCLGAIIPRTFLEKGEIAAEEEFKWWLDLFGEDFYVELQRHGIADQDRCNAFLLKMSEKFNVPVIASNDSHYVDNEDYNSHDILLCINTGELQKTPVIKEFIDDDEFNRKDYRFGFFNDQFYFKDTQEMSKLFADIPQAIDNTNAIVDKIELVHVTNDLLLPNFEIPSKFKTQDDYLAYLTYEGAKKRYREITPAIQDRLNFELAVIKDMGFAGYFLIVSDIIRWSKSHDVFVGSGRGSAAGSAVAYCISITNIDPLKYNLLFERFLNPDRKSMPDIDTDFDDVGRGRVIQYIVEKYGQHQVAQIITHNSMAAKMSIKDVARVLDLELYRSNQLAKLIPEIPGISLGKLLHSGKDDLDRFEPEQRKNIELLQEKHKQPDLEGQVLREAEKLEGTIRNTGIHAAGIIIGPKPLDELMPLCKQKDIELYVTQFDGKVIENAGAIKIDILGLSNLSILKQSIEFVKKNHDTEIELDEIPLDDPKTFELYQRAETIGTFQFASGGMRQYLKQLRPDKIEDLIALNALFRPGPIKYIPEFIQRKHGLKEITYDLPVMQEILEETYGITVYQEQVMLLSQKLAGFSRGDADTLRKAMGKKQKAVLDQMKDKFLEGCETNGHPGKIAEKIWADWEAFAEYAFNKSHSTCYAYLAFHTAYFKANYPSEYMTALLNSKNDLDSLSGIMKECKRMGITILGPDINESEMHFSVKKDGTIRFGLADLKGVGESAISDLLEERNKNGLFTDVFDLSVRMGDKSLNKKALENLVYSGALDSIGDIPRAMYFASAPNQTQNNLELILKYGNMFSNFSKKMSNTLFGDAEEVEIPKPKLTPAEEWNLTKKLNVEKDVVGMFLSAHPLDTFKFELDHYPFHTIEQLNDAVRELEDEGTAKDKSVAREYTFRIAGYVGELRHLESKEGNPYGRFTLNDYSGSRDILLFKENYLRNRHFMIEGNKLVLDIQVTQSTRKTDNRPFINTLRISLLSELKQNFTKRVNIYLPSESLDIEFMAFMEKSAERSGNTELGLHFVDKDNGKEIVLLKKQIECNDEFVTRLNSFPGINFDILPN